MKFQGDLLNVCDFIQVFVFTTNHHLKLIRKFFFFLQVLEIYILSHHKIRIPTIDLNLVLYLEPSSKCLRYNLEKKLSEVSDIDTNTLLAVKLLLGALISVK